MSKILTFIIARLLTQRVVINVSLSFLRYLVKRTDNKLDDEILATVEKALLEDKKQ